MTDGSEPCFEVRDVFGTVYKIWPNGQIDGFGPGCVVINRIPALVLQVAVDACDGARKAEAENG